MNIQGKLLEIGQTEQVKETFQKRTFVLEYTENPEYPEYLSFELIQSNCEQLNGLNQGDEVAVYFNLKGRKWVNKQGETKYFNSLQAWRVEAVNGAHNTPHSEQDDSSPYHESTNDLPF